MNIPSGQGAIPDRRWFAHAAISPWPGASLVAGDGGPGAIPGPTV